MKDWTEAKARVDTMKKVDPKGAERLNKEITPRFQKEYFALQLTGNYRHLKFSQSVICHAGVTYISRPHQF